MKNHLAAINVGTIKGPGTGVLSDPGNTAPLTFGKFISGALGVMTIIAAIWFLFKIIMGGITLINSDGDKQAVESARGSITNGVIGIVVIISATFLVGLVSFLLGIDNPLNISGWVLNLAI